MGEDGVEAFAATYRAKRGDSRGAALIAMTFLPTRRFDPRRKIYTSEKKS